MKKIVTWILIADGARARILRSDGRGSPLIPVVGEIEGDNRRAGEIGVERPGRAYDPSGAGRHAMEPRVDWHELEKHQFAKYLAAHLSKSAQKKAFGRLALVAPAKVLGDLRAALSKQATELVIAELSKDLTGIPDRELPTHLEKILPL